MSYAGRLRDWWTNSTVQAFEERAQCVARQYSKYYVYDANGQKVFVNGNLTNGEDIADSGLAQAYGAWKASLKTSADQTGLRLPGLDFSEDQLFFISFARIWANLIRPASAVSRVRTDPHSPAYWRVTGPLRNMEAFHKAFGCKTGSPVSGQQWMVCGKLISNDQMNPPETDQCELW